MLYVIDASVVAKWFLPEPYKEKADALLDDFLHRRLSLVAPDLLVPEVGNTLWKRSALMGEISTTEAKESYVDFLNLRVPLEPSSTIAERALTLAQEGRHPIYDALYVATALNHNCELITADETLVNKLSNKFPQIRWLGSL